MSFFKFFYQFFNYYFILFLNFTILEHMYTCGGFISIFGINNFLDNYTQGSHNGPWGEN